MSLFLVNWRVKRLKERIVKIYNWEGENINPLTIYKFHDDSLEFPEDCIELSLSGFKDFLAKLRFRISAFLVGILNKIITNPDLDIF